MEREAFLDAQLWLRRLPAGDALLKLPERAPTARDVDDDAPAVLVPLLPPPASDERPSDAQMTPPVAVMSWCCFEADGLTCFFQGGQDATQLRFELLQTLPARRYVLRFERTLAYELQTARLQRLSLSPRPEARESDTDEAHRRSPPPSAVLDFGSVCMRVWMDPEQLRPLDAHRMLTANLYIQRGGERVPYVEHAPTWRRAFRHNASIGGALGKRPRLAKSSPKAFMDKARAILVSNADIEAVKMVVDSIVRKRQRKDKYKNPSSQSSSQGAVLSDCFTDAEIVLLFTEMAHLFGEDHPCVNQLMDITEEDAKSMCEVHERCYKLRDHGGISSCASQKWAAWDEYLESSHHLLVQSRKRRRPVGEPSLLDSHMQTAADALRQAIVEDEDRELWATRTCDANSQLDAIERSAFRTLGLLSSQSPDAATTSHSFPEAAANSTEPHAGREQQLRTAEQLFAALLHKRRQLARDALVLELLPHRQRLEPNRPPSGASSRAPR